MKKVEPFTPEELRRMATCLTESGVLADTVFWQRLLLAIADAADGREVKTRLGAEAVTARGGVYGGNQARD